MFLPLGVIGYEKFHARVTDGFSKRELISS